MRKVLILFFAAALVVACSWSAQAAGKYLGAPDISFRGWYMTTGYTNDNVFDFNDDTHDATRAVFTRFRWWFDASFDGKYGGTIGFEWNWTWGVDPNDSTSNAADALVGSATVTTAPSLTLVQNNLLYARGHTGAMGDDQTNNWRMKHAYVWFMVPHTPAKVTVGLQTFIIDPDIIMHGDNGDWWGVRVDLPIIKGMLNVTAAWMKQDEGRSFGQNISFSVSPTGSATVSRTAGVGGTNRDGDDSDYWFINITGSLAKWLSYGFYTEWLHVRNHGYTSLDAIAPTLARPNLDAIDGDYLWHGLHVSVRTPMFYARLHGNIFWGNMSDTAVSQFLSISPAGIVAGTGVLPDLDPFGYAFIGRAGVTLGPFEIGLKGWYFSGNNDDLYDPTNPQWDRWATPDAWFAPFEIFYGGERQWADCNLGYVGSPGGSAALALESDWQVTKKLLLDLIAGYIWATNKEDKPAWSYFNPVTGQTNDDTGLGFEVDLRATYHIYEHLSLDLVAAYFVADSGLDRFDPAGGFEEADDAYELFWRLLFTF